MAPVVSICVVHGAFESSAFRFFDSSSVRLSGNFEPCPVAGCKVPARVMEGKFNFDADGFARVVSAPDWSVAALDAIQASYMHAAALIESGRAQDPAALIRRLNRANASNARHARPEDQQFTSVVQDEVAEQLKAAGSIPNKHSRKTRIMAVLTAAGIFFSAYPGAKAFVNDVADVAADVIPWVAEQITSGHTEVTRESIPNEMLPVSWRIPPK